MKKFIIASLLVSSTCVVTEAQAWGRAENVALGVAAITYMAIRQPEVRVQNYQVYPQRPQPYYQHYPYQQTPVVTYQVQPCMSSGVPVRNQYGEIIGYAQRCN